VIFPLFADVEPPAADHGAAIQAADEVVVVEEPAVFAVLVPETVFQLPAGRGLVRGAVGFGGKAIRLLAQGLADQIDLLGVNPVEAEKGVGNKFGRGIAQTSGHVGAAIEGGEAAPVAAGDIEHHRRLVEAAVQPGGGDVNFAAWVTHCSTLLLAVAC